MCAMMSMSTRSSPSSSTSMAIRRPGWIARRRARGGIAHPRDRIGIGYASAIKAVHLSVRELAGHGAAFGGPGSGKTTFLQLLVEAAADRAEMSGSGGWLDRLGHQRGGIEDSGARGLDRALGVLLDGVAMRGSLRSRPEALRLEDVLETNGLVLFSLDAAEYPYATRKVASWVLLGMGRRTWRCHRCMRPRFRHSCSRVASTIRTPIETASFRACLRCRHPRQSRRPPDRGGGQLAGLGWAARPGRKRRSGLL
jgi:hypothetical protein